MVGWGDRSSGRASDRVVGWGDRGIGWSDRVIG